MQKGNSIMIKVLIRRYEEIMSEMTALALEGSDIMTILHELGYKIYVDQVTGKVKVAKTTGEGDETDGGEKS
jgi:hypothetical protein